MGRTVIWHAPCSKHSATFLLPVWGRKDWYLACLLLPTLSNLFVACWGKEGLLSGMPLAPNTQQPFCCLLGEGRTVIWNAPCSQHSATFLLPVRGTEGLLSGMPLAPNTQQP